MKATGEVAVQDPSGLTVDLGQISRRLHGQLTRPELLAMKRELSGLSHTAKILCRDAQRLTAEEHKYLRKEANQRVRDLSLILFNVEMRLSLKS